MVCRLVAVLAALAAVATARPAGGDPPRRAPATRIAVGIGGYLSLSGLSEYGPAAEAEIYPASWGRFGVRAAYYGYDYEVGGAMLTAGLLYEAASSRPHLQIGLHADVAATVDAPDRDDVVGVGGGVQTQLWVLGPVALGLDVTAHLLANRDDLVLVLASATTIRLSF